MPNDPISIYGKGLANPTSVTFNAVAATVVESSANYIKVTVPSTATSGLIHVQVGRDGANSPSAFTVLGPMTITPSHAALQPGTTQQFTAPGPVTFTIEGIAGGAAEVGLITPAGLYTAPAASSGPLPRTVTVRAFSPDRPTNQAEAVVDLLGGALPSPPVSFARDPAATSATPLAAAGVSFARTDSPAQAAPLAASLVAFAREPVITAVSPATVAQGATNIVLTGKGLANPTMLQFLLNGANDNSISVSSLTANRSGTQATATITVGGSACPGARVVQITAGAPSTPAGTGNNILQVTGTPCP